MCVRSVEPPTASAPFITISLSCFHFPMFTFRVMIHIVAQCHEEGLEHYLRSYVKVKFTCHISQLTIFAFCVCTKEFS